MIFAIIGTPPLFDHVPVCSTGSKDTDNSKNGNLNSISVSAGKDFTVQVLNATVNFICKLLQFRSFTLAVQVPTVLFLSKLHMTTYPSVLIDSFHIFAISEH